MTVHRKCPRIPKENLSFRLGTVSDEGGYLLDQYTTLLGYLFEISIVVLEEGLCDLVDGLSEFADLIGNLGNNLVEEVRRSFDDASSPGEEIIGLPLASFGLIASFVEADRRNLV